MWISYSDSEVKKFHPVCENALNKALIKLGLDKKYKVLHHKLTGTLEMDFVVQNLLTNKYLCVIEVKRTQADLNSARYQYQTMSYVQNNSLINEKPFYILTNLEYLLPFRYDSSRPRVFQQMLKPGLTHIADFDSKNQSDFEDELASCFSVFLLDFISNKYDYLMTLETFERHMRNIASTSSNWKSSLALLLYEYIRGSFLAIGRKDLIYDVRTFKKNVQRICDEAIKVNFSEIFSYSPTEFSKTIAVDGGLLSDIFDFGRQNITGDSVSNVLHEIASDGHEHDGEVPTDLELARIVSILAKNISGMINRDEYICDPAAGSGNLITTAIDIFNISPKQSKVNDINKKLLELLSLRIGLRFSATISTINSPEISTQDIISLSKFYFDDVSVIVLNPPFVAGINCVERKQPFFKTINSITKRPALTDFGQMNLEAVFLELVCSLSKKGTTIACILPRTHLTARGPEAVILRKMLINVFGLKTIFVYPEEGLFEKVTKGTCVVVGKTGSKIEKVRIISSIDKVEDIDLSRFENSLVSETPSSSYLQLIPGVEWIEKDANDMLINVKEGWREVSREYSDSIGFYQSELLPNTKLTKLSSIPLSFIKRKRGSAGNTGASDLIFFDTSSILYKKYSSYVTIPAVRNAKMHSVDISLGDSRFPDITSIKPSDLTKMVVEYLSLPYRSGKQQRKSKNPLELEKMLIKEYKNIFPSNSILVPRGIRSEGKVYYAPNPTIVSTNFVVLSMCDTDFSKIITSWMNTIFYQMICELNGKQQEGMRKMEMADIESTLIPNISKITDLDKKRIISGFGTLSFVNLNSPIIQKNDVIWAEILFGTEAKLKLDDAKRLLELIANSRNPK